MNLTINSSALNSFSPAFSQKPVSKKGTVEYCQQLNNQNPISRKGEVMNLIKTTFVGGLGISAWLLMELVETGTTEPFEHVYNKVANAKKDKNILIKIGATVSIIAAAACGVALLYTIFNTPKIAYESKVNAFKKGKEMDVYIKANNAEKELYSQLTDEAKKATNALEQNKLKSQYAQLALAKNKVPDFVKKTKKDNVAVK